MDFHGGYGNLKGHKEDSLVVGVLLYGDVGTEALGSNSCCCLDRGAGWLFDVDIWILRAGLNLHQRLVPGPGGWIKGCLAAAMWCV